MHVFNRLNTFLIFLLLSNLVWSNDQVSILVIDAENEARLEDGISLESSTSILVDTLSHYTIEDVATSSQFTPLSQFKFSSKYERGKYQYWLKFELKNSLPDSMSVSFFCGNFDSLRIYENRHLMDEFGKMVLGEDKNTSQLVNASVLQLGAFTETEFIVKMSNSPGIPRHIEPIIINEKSLMLDLFLQSSDQWYVLYIQFGALIIMLIYFIIQLCLRRSRHLLFYTSYVFFMFIYLTRSVFMSHPTLQIYPPGFFDYYYYAVVTMAVLISYIYFIRQIIIDLDIEDPVILKILKVITVIALCWFATDRILLLVDYTLAWKFSNIFHVISMAFYILIAAYFVNMQHPTLRLIGFGTLLLNLFFLVIIIIKINYSFTDTKFGTWMNPSTCLVVLIELFIFIIAIKKLDVATEKEQKQLLQKITTEKNAFIGASAVVKRDQIDQDDNEFLNNLNDIIEKQMENPQFNATKLYQLLGTNHVSLNKKLKDLTGSSAHQYIHQKKMQYSKHLVLHSTKSISEIAFQIGLNDSAYFSKVFKKTFGHPPSHFRKQLKNHPHFQNLPA